MKKLSILLLLLTALAGAVLAATTQENLTMHEETTHTAVFAVH